jgi:hypothetical protein
MLNEYTNWKLSDNKNTIIIYNHNPLMELHLTILII